jgi:hypothetical protein
MAWPTSGLLAGFCEFLQTRPRNKAQGRPAVGLEASDPVTFDGMSQNRGVWADASGASGDIGTQSEAVSRAPTISPRPRHHEHKHGYHRLM